MNGTARRGLRPGRLLFVGAILFFSLCEIGFAQRPWEDPFRDAVRPGGRGGGYGRGGSYGRGGGYGRGRRGGWFSDYRPERDIFPSNCFTFARVRYSSYTGHDKWAVDYPDSDINFSQRLSELTTIDVNKNDNGDFQTALLDLTDEELFKYPFLYMIEPGELEFREEEVESLRSYLLRGGFMLVDDFWGEREWQNFKYEIERVLPPETFSIVDIPLSHEIFRCVFRVTVVPQVPSIHHWQRSGVTYERYDAQVPHCYGIFDLNGRLMVVIMHNSDLGDGWEREAEDEEYFREFSAKLAYPMGINIVVYAMTH